MNEVNKQKLEQASKYLQENKIDLWLIFASEGSDPAVKLLTGLKTVGRTAFLITKENQKYAVCSVIDAQESRDSGLFDKVYTYQNNLPEVLKGLIEQLNPSQIAINYSVDDNLCDGLTMGRYRWLKKNLGEEISNKFVSSEKMLQKIRSIKTPKEIDTIRQAIKMTQEIYDVVFSKLKVGMTEYQVGEIFLEEMSKRGVVEAGSKELTMPIVMKERISHRAPGNAVIQKGDFLIMDFGIDYRGYCSDIARTAYFLKDGETKAPKEIQEKFDAAHEAITRASKAAHPGVIGYEVDKVAREYLLSVGMPEITHATGHQLGQFEHDGGAMFAPRWERYGNAPYGTIEENMVLTLEPTILNDDDYSILCEEDILVTKDGAEFLSKRQDELVLIS